MCHWDRNIGRNFGKPKLWKGEEGKNLCYSSGSTEFQEGANHFVKTDRMKNKEKLSLKSMGLVHPTKHHLSEE